MHERSLGLGCTVLASPALCGAGDGDSAEHELRIDGTRGDCERSRFVAQQGMDNATPVVELWAMDPGLCVIVRASTGIVFSNQVGGTACRHPRVEGILVPIGQPLWLSERTETAPDPLLEYYERLADSEAKLLTTRQRLIGEWLRWADLNDVFEPRGDEEVAEAWIPVRVATSLSEGFAPVLGAFAGKPAFLTYQNSD